MARVKLTNKDNGSVIFAQTHPVGGSAYRIYNYVNVRIDGLDYSHRDRNSVNDTFYRKDWDVEYVTELPENIGSVVKWDRGIDPRSRVKYYAVRTGLDGWLVTGEQGYKRNTWILENAKNFTVVEGD